VGFAAVSLLCTQGANGVVQSAAEKIRVVRLRLEALSAARKISSIMRGHAALLAMKSGRPVKIVYDAWKI